MKAQGLFEEVHDEVGDIIVAKVNLTRVKQLLDPDRIALMELITKQKAK